MTQIGTINSFEGVTAARLFGLSGDSILATASSVVAGSNDPTLYTITFSGVAAGEYRLALFEGSEVVDSGAVVVFTAGGWSVKDCCDTQTTTPDPDPVAPTVSNSVATAIANPKEASADGVMVKSHSLPELIEAEKYLAAKAAAKKSHRGLRFSRVIPGGTTQ